MELLIIRHAQAEDFAMNDSARVLTEKGRKQAKLNGLFLKKNDLLPDLVLASPYARAKESAEIACDSAGIAEPTIVPWLACGMSPDKACRELAAYSEFQRVAIFGHNPDFAELAEFLLGVTRGAFHVKKASVIHFTQFNPRSKRAYFEMMVPVQALND